MLITRLWQNSCLLHGSRTHYTPVCHPASTLCYIKGALLCVLALNVETGRKLWGTELTLGTRWWPGWKPTAERNSSCEQLAAYLNTFWLRFAVTTPSTPQVRNWNMSPPPHVTTVLTPRDRHIYSYGQFRVSHLYNLYVFGLWVETGAPRGGPIRSTGLNPGPFCCDVPLCHCAAPRHNSWTKNYQKMSTYKVRNTTTQGHSWETFLTMTPLMQHKTTYAAICTH